MTSARRSEWPLRRPRAAHGRHVVRVSEGRRFISDRCPRAVDLEALKRLKNRVVREVMRIDDLSNEQLLSALCRVLGDERRAVAAMLAYLIEVEKRRLHLEQACSSLHDFCTRKLGLSEDQASRRIAAARLGARFPELVEAIGDGRMHLSGVLQLRALFTEANVTDLIAEASGKSRTQLDLLVAKHAPKPDVPDTIRPLATQRELVTDAAAVNAATPAFAGSASSPSPSAQLLPLTVERFQIMFTAAAELRDKLELARALLRHVNPNGDLAVVIERALDLLLLHLEKTKLGKAKHPRRSKGRADPGNVSRETLREVHERDAGQCTFVGADGERCLSRDWLEVDHRQPRALGGAGTLENVRLLCRAHNRLVAEQAFGAEHITRKIEEARAARAAAVDHSAPPNLIDSPVGTTAAASASSPATDLASAEAARTKVAGATSLRGPEVDGSVPAVGMDVVSATSSRGPDVGGSAPAAETKVAGATSSRGPDPDGSVPAVGMDVVGATSLRAHDVGGSVAMAGTGGGRANVSVDSVLADGGGGHSGDAGAVDPCRCGAIGAFAPVLRDERTPWEIVRFALVRLGFRERDVGTALARLPSVVWSEPLDVAVRAALRLLT
ncbi:MAG: HNH endonuclease [Labilithrix sp.]|nr:HNH endonuclease [Labilithrix sp.]